MVYDYGLLFDN